MPQQAGPVFSGGIWEQLVLPVLVRNHSSNSHSAASRSDLNQQAVCKLLCCSKAISSGVHAECKGQLSARFCASSLQQSQWFAAWLARNAGLLQQLQLVLHRNWQDGSVGGITSAEVPVAVAHALNIAAARGSLQDLHTWVDHMPSAPVLKALAGVGSLTRLELDFTAVSGWYGALHGQTTQRCKLQYGVNDVSDSDDNDFTPTSRYMIHGHGFTQINKALTCLTQLRDLSIKWSTPISLDDNPLWSALQELRQLTALTTTYATLDMAPRESFTLDLDKFPPTSLKKLVVLPGRFVEDATFGRVFVKNGAPHLGDLAHLTSLTELRAPTAAMGEAEFEQWGNGYWPRVTDDGDNVRAVLPASLEVLQLGAVQLQHMQQLRQLTKLQTLAIEEAVDL
jgi:hypothetical protein